MRKLIIPALIAATVLPAMPAMAQSWGEVRRDQRELREQRQDLRQARRHGDRHDVRRERRDVREARRELRQDWRDYRQHNRKLYRRGHWSSAYRYQPFSRGYRLQPGYYSQRYWINDPFQYRLPRAPYGARWVRNYDDVLLVDTRSGIVLDVIRDFYW